MEMNGTERRVVLLDEMSDAEVEEMAKTEIPAA